MKEQDQPEEIEGIRVTSIIMCLGISIANKRNYFKIRKDNMLNRARQAANTTCSEIVKSCNKMIFGKSFQQSLTLSSFIYSVVIMDLTENELTALLSVEYGVQQQSCGASRYATVNTLKGEIGTVVDGSQDNERKINIIEKYKEWKE